MSHLSNLKFCEGGGGVKAKFCSLHKQTIGSPQCERCVGHLEYAGVEDDHDETGDVEGAEGGVDDELRVVETTEVHLYHSHLIKATIMSRMMRGMMTSSTKP